MRFFAVSLLALVLLYGASGQILFLAIAAAAAFGGVAEGAVRMFGPRR